MAMQGEASLPNAFSFVTERRDLEKSLPQGHFPQLQQRLRDWYKTGICVRICSVLVIFSCASVAVFSLAFAPFFGWDYLTDPGALFSIICFWVSPLIATFDVILLVRMNTLIVSSERMLSKKGILLTALITPIAVALWMYNTDYLLDVLGYPFRISQATAETFAITFMWHLVACIAVLTCSWSLIWKRNEIKFPFLQRSRLDFFKFHLVRIIAESLFKTVAVGVVLVIWRTISSKDVYKMKMRWLSVSCGMLYVQFLLIFVWSLGEVCILRIFSERWDFPPMTSLRTNDFDIRMMCLMRILPNMDKDYLWLVSLLEFERLAEYDMKARERLFASHIYFPWMSEAIVSDFDTLIKECWEYVTQMSESKGCVASLYRSSCLYSPYAHLFRSNDAMIKSANVISLMIVASFQEDKQGKARFWIHRVLSTLLSTLEMLEIVAVSCDVHSRLRPEYLWPKNLECLHRSVECAVLRIVKQFHKDLGAFTFSRRNSVRLDSYLRRI